MSFTAAGRTPKTMFVATLRAPLATRKIDNEDLFLMMIPDYGHATTRQGGSAMGTPDDKIATGASGPVDGGRIGRG